MIESCLRLGIHRSSFPACFQTEIGELFGQGISGQPQDQWPSIQELADPGACHDQAARRVMAKASMELRCQRVRPPIFIGAGNEPSLTQRQTVETPQPKCAATSRTER